MQHAVEKEEIPFPNTYIYKCMQTLFSVGISGERPPQKSLYLCCRSKMICFIPIYCKLKHKNVFVFTLHTLK